MTTPRGDWMSEIHVDNKNRNLTAAVRSPSRNGLAEKTNSKYKRPIAR